MSPIRLLYISLSGNTRAFVKKLATYAEQRPHGPQFELVEISDNSLDHHETTPFFAFVPTYLDGGNGIDSGVTEIMTTALFDQIDFLDNADHLLGIVGSGNKNFNIQYVLTARRYAETFQVPLIADYELRGTERDVARVYEALVSRITEQLGNV